jgi:DNA-binding transcriptional LysR family regulator
MSNTEWPDQDEREVRQLDAQLLADLWIFRAAARAGSISAAATQLNVTAGAVSQRVLRIEARLKVTLFERRKGKMTLTQAGSIMLEAMNGASMTLNDALARIELPQRVSVVVSCAPSLASEWLMPHLQDFYRECSDVDLLVRAETVMPSASWMAQEGIDVHIHYMHGRPDDLVELTSLREFTFPVCSRDYRTRLRALPVEERVVVAMHDDDAWREGESARAEWAEWFASAGANRSFVIKGERHFNQAALAYQAAVYGQGMAMGRAVSVHGLLKAGKLVCALDVAPVPSAHYRLLARSAAAPGSPVARFAAWVESALARTQKETITLLGIDS